MKRILLYVFFSAFVICGTAYCHTFEATYASENGTEAVLRDTVTDDEWVVQVGDEIDGYRVIQISREHVTIVHPGDNGIIYMTEIQINGARQTRNASP